MQPNMTRTKLKFFFPGRKKPLRKPYITSFAPRRYVGYLSAAQQLRIIADYFRISWFYLRLAVILIAGLKKRLKAF